MTGAAFPNRRFAVLEWADPAVCWTDVLGDLDRGLEGVPSLAPAGRDAYVVFGMGGGALFVARSVTGAPCDYLMGPLRVIDLAACRAEMAFRDGWPALSDPDAFRGLREKTDPGLVVISRRMEDNVVCYSLGETLGPPPLPLRFL